VQKLTASFRKYFLTGGKLFVDSLGEGRDFTVVRGFGGVLEVLIKW